MREPKNPGEHMITGSEAADTHRQLKPGSTPSATGFRRRSGIRVVVSLVASLLCVAALIGVAVSLGRTTANVHEGATAAPTFTVFVSQPSVTSIVSTSTDERPATATSRATLSQFNPTLPPSPTPVESTATPMLTATATVTAVPTVSSTAIVTVAKETTQRQLRIFRSLWTIVNNEYVYPDFNGVNWRAIRTTTEPRILAGISDSQFYGLMRDLIDSLKDDHSSFLSPDEARQESEDYSGTGEYVGVGITSDINVARKYVYVLQVLPRSPAEAAGIHPHDHILSINGQASVDSKGKSNISLLRGSAGTTVTLTIGAPDGTLHSVVITRARLSTSSPVEYHILPGGKRIGYLMVPTFFEQDIETQVRNALHAMMSTGNLDGLIVDMRLNGGGSYPVLVADLGFYTHGRVGTLVDRSDGVAPVNVPSESVGNSQTVPMVVLMGPMTESYAEVFSGVLQATGRARLIGQRSAGNIETLRAHRFEDGSVAWIAEETFHLPDGMNWEGKGLIPDIAVNKAWDDYTAANDPVVAAAVKALSGDK